MLTVWRIVRRKRAAEAFTGEGARAHGGRWNSKGVAMVYCSSSIALAALETLVHINPHLPLDYVVIKAEFNAALVEDLSAATFPAGWDAEPPGPASMTVGDKWVRETRSAILNVPSCITGESNFLLNPQHKDFKQIKIGMPKAFTFDPRLL